MAEARFQGVTTSSFSQQIADQIEGMILNRELRSGDKLPTERELAGSFGVSRPAVREGLKLLAQRGLVEARQGDGTYVADPGMAAVISSITVASRLRNTTIDDITDVRICLEVPIAGLAALRATEEDIQRIEAALHVMDECVPHLDRPENRLQMVKADLEFHTALAAATHNPLFTILSNSIFDILLDERAKSQTASTVVNARGHNYHRVILGCVKQGDEEGARQAMQAHLHYHARMKLRPAESIDLSESDISG